MISSTTTVTWLTIRAQAAHVGVLLYFLAGLLPNPDGPWSPTTANCNAWVTAVLLEAVIAAVFKTEQCSINAPSRLLDVLSSLGVARIVLLVVMIALLVRRQFAIRASTSASTEEERQGLLENGQGSVAGYNGTNGHAATPKPPPGKPGTQNKGWLDYFAGFRVLFPYLW